MRIIFLIWILVVAVLSLFPFPDNHGSGFEGFFGSSGAGGHVTAYFVGAILCYYAFKFDGKAFIFLSAFAVFLWGIVFEFIQIWLPYRTFNPADIVANAVGVGVFVLIWSAYLYVVRRKLF